MSRQAPYPESPYHRIYTQNRSFSQLRPGPAAPQEEPMPQETGPVYFQQHLGMVLTHTETGHVQGRMELKPWMKNPIGSVHGGVLFSFADTSSGASVVTYGHSVTTVDGSIDYLAPALTSTTLFSDARVVKHGRTLSVVECSITDETGKLLARTHMTFYNLTEAMARDGQTAPIPALKETMEG